MSIKVKGVLTNNPNLNRYVRLFTNFDGVDAESLARDLLPTGSHDDAYWYAAAVSLTTAMILHNCYCAYAESRESTLEDLVASFEPARWQAIVAKALTYNHDPQGLSQWKTPDDQPTRTNPLVQTLLENFRQRPESEVVGIVAQINRALAPDRAAETMREAARRSNFTEQRLSPGLRRQHPLRAARSRHKKESA